RSIFTGYKTDQDLFDSDGKYNVDITNGENFEYNVGIAERVQVNTLGNKVFGRAEYDNGKLNTDNPNYDKQIDSSDDDNNTPYLIAMFEKLEGALDSSDQEDLQSSLTDIKESRNNILSIT